MNLLDQSGKFLSFVLTRAEAERLLDGLYRRKDKLGESAAQLIEKLITAGVDFPPRPDRVRTEYMPPH